MSTENKCYRCGQPILKTQAEIGMRNTGAFHLKCWNALPEEARKTMLEMTKL